MLAEVEMSLKACQAVVERPAATQNNASRMQGYNENGDDGQSGRIAKSRNRRRSGRRSTAT